MVAVEMVPPNIVGGLPQGAKVLVNIMFWTS
jgi:hypothetical protein